MMEDLLVLWGHLERGGVEKLFCFKVPGNSMAWKNVFVFQYEDGKVCVLLITCVGKHCNVTCE